MMDQCLTLLTHGCRSHCVKIRECGNVEYDDSEWFNIIVKNEFVFNSSSYIICIVFYQKIPGIENMGRGTFRNARKRLNELIYVPYISDSILDFIKKIELSAEDNINNGTLVVAKIKKQIEDKLDEDPILRKSRKINILDEIQQLKKSTLPSKEITELQTTTSTLKSDTLQLTKLVEDSKYCSAQSDLKISQLLQENKQEKEKHDSDLSTMKSSISQLQEDMKMLFRKTSELQYENTLLKKMLEEKIKTKQLSDSSGLSFTQANTIGQALMQQDVFNCM